MAFNSNDTEDGKEHIITFDPLYRCPRIDGVLFPEPIRTVPETTPPPSPTQCEPVPATTPPSSPTQHGSVLATTPPSSPTQCGFVPATTPPSSSTQHRSVTATPPPSSPAQHEQPQSSTSTHKRKRRTLAASRVLETKEFSLNLLKCEGDSSFILEMGEVEGRNNKTYYIMRPYEKSGKKKIEPKEITLGGRVVLPVTEEVNPINVENKHKLSLKERLEGKWCYEVRERTGTTKTEKFYFHEKVNKTMRSFNDVATFVLYGMIY